MSDSKFIPVQEFFDNPPSKADQPYKLTMFHIDGTQSETVIEHGTKENANGCK